MSEQLTMIRETLENAKTGEPIPAVTIPVRGDIQLFLDRIAHDNGYSKYSDSLADIINAGIDKLK